MSLKDTESRLIAQIQAWERAKEVSEAALRLLAKGEVEKADQQIDKLALWLDQLVKARLS